MNDRSVVLAELWRGGILEAVHKGAWVECDVAGEVLSGLGDPTFVTTLRSAGKPLQALPLTMLPGRERLALTDEELAVCCASHPGTQRHVDLVGGILARIGVDYTGLVCGPVGDPPSSLKHGCSGNHAAMLAEAWIAGQPLEGYQRPDHPTQRALRAMIGDMIGEAALPTALDGCGVPTYGLSLRQMARLYALLGSLQGETERVPRAMGRHADLMGAPDWIDVRLMQVTDGRVVAKTGAEGLLCLALVGQGRGMAVKVTDGSARALGVITIAALRRCGWIGDAEALHPSLGELRNPIYRASTGAVAAELRPTRD